MVRTWVIGAVVLALWTAAAQATAHAIINEALSLDDVRRPVYRGNIRYNLSFPNNLVKQIFESEPSRSKYMVDVFRGINLKKNDERIKRISYRSNNFEHSATTPVRNNTIKNTKHMHEVGLESGKKNNKNEVWSQVQLTTDVNETKIVKKFLENSLNDLEKSSESLDKLILSHTEANDKHIQMYPEGSPPSWSEAPMKANMILIEDVHPSKLPKPQYTQIALYHTPNRPNENSQQEKPIWSNLGPQPNKPTWTNDHHAPNAPDYSRPTVTKPSHYYGPPVTKPSQYHEPAPTKPSHYYEPASTKPPHSYDQKPTKPSHYYEPVPTIPSHYFPTKPSHYYETVPTKPSNIYDISKPIVSNSVHQYPHKPTYKPPELNKPTYIHSKPLTVKPAFEHNTEPSYRPVITTSTHLPKPILITEVVTQYTPIYIKPPPEPPPKRPPPPTIVVLESPSDNYIDCGTVQIVNSASFKDCPDVTVVFNAASNTSAAPPETHAALVPTSSPAAGPTGIVGVVPVPPLPLPPPPLRPPSIIIPVSEEDDEDDDEYDYEEELDDEVPSTSTTTTTTAAPTRPHQPTSLLSYIMTSLPFLGPITVSLWIILLGPLSFILIGVMGVASFLIPWVAPSLLRFG